MNMKHLYTSLDSGVTSGSVTDNSITDDSVIEIYFDNTDCYIDSTSQSGHTVYFTVGGNATGTNVCVVVNNLTNFTPYDDTNVMQRVSTLETDVETLDNLVTTLETDVETLETRVDGLNASNINYDEHSTLYSAMGDIDELETTSKNLVGAINEVKESGGSINNIITQEILVTNVGGFSSAIPYPNGVTYENARLLQFSIFPPDYTYSRIGVNPISGNESSLGRFFLEMRENGLFIYNTISTYQNKKIIVSYFRGVI